MIIGGKNRRREDAIPRDEFVGRYSRSTVISVSQGIFSFRNVGGSVILETNDAILEAVIFEEIFL